MSTTSPELYHDFLSDIIKCDVYLHKQEVINEKALVMAAAEGNYLTLEQLLRSGVSADTEEYNKLLYYACKKYLTPLQVATLKGHDRCVELLLDHGADVNGKDLFGITALHLAACSGFHDILKILLRSEADCSIYSYCASLKFPQIHCTIPPLSGTTPLHLAAATNNVDCVKELIRYGADFNAVDEHGRTSLYIAAQLGFRECVLIHLKEALGRDILSLPSFSTSDTPLHFAVKFHMFECIKELLYLGSDVNHRNFDGLSPLHLAMLPANSNPDFSLEQLEILKLLVLESYKVDVNQPDWEGYTPLHYVCFNRHRNMWSRRPEFAKFLIAYGANVNIKDYRKYSLLEQELTKYPEENYDILKYIVKSLLYLPRLRSLNITPQTESQSSNQIQLLNEENHPERPTYHDWIHFQRLNARRLDPAHAFEVANMDMDMDLDLDLDLDERRPPYDFPRSIHMHPAFDHHHPFPMDDFMDPYDFNDIQVIENENINEEEAKEASDLLLKKQLWYENMACNPRTLQHHCRFLIRKTVGPAKLKYINKLPLPPVLKSYLLFELDK